MFKTMRWNWQRGGFFYIQVARFRSWRDKISIRNCVGSPVFVDAVSQASLRASSHEIASRG